MRQTSEDGAGAAALPQLMLEGEDTRALATPFWNWVVERHGLRASVTGFEVAFGLIAALTLREAWVGHLGIAARDPADLYVYLSIVDALLIGYLVAARISVARAARATFDALGDALDLSPARRTELREQMGRYRRRRFRLAGIGGALCGFLAPLVIHDGALHPFIFDGWTPEFTVRRMLAPVVGWMFGTYILATIREAARVSNLARHLRAVDLFDGEALRPFSRFGLQVAFLAAGLVSVSALLITERGFGHVVVILICVAALAAGAGLLLPLRGLRDRISEEKRRELACCRDALRRARDAMVEGRAIPTEHGRISEVVAYRKLVESIDEWPIDTPTALRACGSVALPVISWFSGSVAPGVVLRMIDILVR